MTPVLKIYGERNTGTNYLGELLQLNYDLRLLPGGHPEDRWPYNARFRGSEIFREWWHYRTFSRNLGWKHTAIRPGKFLPAFRRFENLNVIYLVKNPYSWILSLRHRPYHAPANRKAADSLETFLQTPWRPLWREHLPAGRTYTPSSLWSAKISSYLETPASVPSAIIRYEDLLQDPFAVLEQLEARFNWKRTGNLSNLEKATKGDPRTFEHYRHYYLNEIWREHLTPQTIHTINQDLDTHCLEACGYSRITG